jgi:hypothetical protein
MGVKMRLSVLEGDPNRTYDAHKYYVFLNGEKQTHCIIADSDNGYVLRYKKTKLGSLCADRSGKFQTEEVFGNVVIESR